MHFALPYRRAVTAAAIAAALTLGATAGPLTAANARPIKVGAVTGLDATITKPSGSPYHLHATWSAASNATAYKAKLVQVSSTVTTLATATVPAPTTAWDVSTALPVGTQVRITITPTNGTRKGKPATRTFVLPDVTPPVGQYQLTGRTGSTVTLGQLSASDDNPAGIVSRSVRWDADGAFESWPLANGDSLQHAYPVPSQETVHAITVRLEDAAHLVSTYDLEVRLGDEVAPGGAVYDATPGTAWATLTQVTLSETAAAADPDHPGDPLVREVNWGDAGDTWVAWPSGTTISHVYPAAGSYTPTVRVTDQALNAATFAADQVTVAADTVAPAVTIRLPRTKRSYVSSWTTVKGKATDVAGTGVAKVQARAVERRGTSWYAYKPGSHTWAKAGATKAAALARAPWFTATLASTGLWSARLAHLRLGLLVVQARGVDLVHNTSAPVARKQLLSH